MPRQACLLSLYQVSTRGTIPGGASQGNRGGVSFVTGLTRELREYSTHTSSDDQPDGSIRQSSRRALDTSRFVRFIYCQTIRLGVVSRGKTKRFGIEFSKHSRSELRSSIMSSGMPVKRKSSRIKTLVSSTPEGSFGSATRRHLFENLSTIVRITVFQKNEGGQ